MMTNGLKRIAKPPAVGASSSSSLLPLEEPGDDASREPDSASKKRKSFNPLEVTWLEKYGDGMDKIWNRIPNFVRSAVATCAIFLLGATMRGEWLIIAVHLAKQMGYDGTTVSNDKDGAELDGSTDSGETLLKRFYLENLLWFWLSACTISYGMYFSIGGFLHWYFYVRQRDRAEEWKCQPQKWLNPELERHEIIYGSFSLFLTSTLTCALACYIHNGGPSTIYYQYDEFSWVWWFLSWPVIYVYLDYTTYWLHRIYHTPWLYKHFHKLHHTYKQPTAFSVTAIHPVEILHIQSTLVLPLFLVPIHWVPYCTIVIYNYYHGILDHSGVNFKAHWWQPWQPDAIFHDNHHQYFHVNFGFNCFIWDKLHGTYRQKDRIYGENVFYGKGKSINEATNAEINAEIEERNSENPLAYRGNEVPYKISKEELKPAKSD